MRKSLLAVLAIASLAFVSACGASGGSDSSDTTSAEAPTTTEAPEQTTTTEAAGVAVEDWADSFCGSFSTWLTAITAASDSAGDGVTPGDIQSAKDALATLFGSASTATQTLISDVEAAGAPDIEDGDQLVDDLITKFQAFDDAAQAAAADVEALGTDDLATFQAEADKLSTTFQDEVNTVADSFSEIDAKYPDSDLNAALTKSCDF